jgi:hypothetical protein
MSRGSLRREAKETFGLGGNFNFDFEIIGALYQAYIS